MPYFMNYMYTQKTKFHVAQTLSYKNGFMQSARPKLAVGGEPLHYNQLNEAELDELARLVPHSRMAMLLTQPPWSLYQLMWPLTKR